MEKKQIYSTTDKGNVVKMLFFFYFIKNNNILWPTDMKLMIFTTFTPATLLLEIQLFVSSLKIIYLISLDTNSPL